MSTATSFNSMRRHIKYPDDARCEEVLAFSLKGLLRSGSAVARIERLGVSGPNVRQPRKYGIAQLVLDSYQRTP